MIGIPQTLVHGTPFDVGAGMLVGVSYHNDDNILHSTPVQSAIRENQNLSFVRMRGLLVPHNHYKIVANSAKYYATLFAARVCKYSDLYNAKTRSCARGADF